LGKQCSGRTVPGNSAGFKALSKGRIPGSDGKTNTLADEDRFLLVIIFSGHDKTRKSSGG
jgi:hypothetical protein